MTKICPAVPDVLDLLFKLVIISVPLLARSDDDVPRLILLFCSSLRCDRCLLGYYGKRTGQNVLTSFAFSCHQVHVTSRSFCMCR